MEFLSRAKEIGNAQIFCRTNPLCGRHLTPLSSKRGDLNANSHLGDCEECVSESVAACPSITGYRRAERAIRRSLRVDLNQIGGIALFHCVSGRANKSGKDPIS